jgi:hypothetical protein
MNFEKQAVRNIWDFLDDFSGKQEPGIGLVDILALPRGIPEHEDDKEPPYAD